MALESGIQIMLTRDSDAGSLDHFLAGPTDSDDQAPGDTMYLACPRAEAMFTESENDLSLVQAISSLPLVQRRVLDLLFVEDLTFRQIGDRLGMSDAMAIKHRNAAFARLRSLLPEM